MKTASLVCLCSLVSLLAGDPPANVTVTKETAFTFYRDFKRLTQEPHRVAEMIISGCSSGPWSHAKGTRGIHVYVNPLADDAVIEKRKVFPAGAVIVKEKLGDDGAVTGVGGMIKRTAGFDPKNGDWEYFYSEKVGFSTGRLQHCADCHSVAKETDYVFRAWKPFN